MARVTVEDCIQIIPNRFELVTLAAQRARQISSGSPLTLERDNDKDHVVSLREIAEKTIDPQALHAELILDHQKYGKADVIDDSAPRIGGGVAAGAQEDLEGWAQEAAKMQESMGDLSFDGEDIDEGDEA